jgi:cellulose synthase/poly-beta-1,6-N-acetylglucosamine synthase-like glycosyltransferase
LLLEVFAALFVALTIIMVAYLIRHYIFTLIVLGNAQKLNKNTQVTNTSYKPMITVLIPAHDEEKVIGRLLQRMTELTYPKEKLQIIMIDDASADTTGTIAEKYSNTHNYFTVLHRNKEEGARGKAAALNAGLKRATGEIVICFDADYYPQKDILEKLAREFADPKVAAVQGRVIVLNEPKSLVTRLVALERIGGYGVDQYARNSLSLITQFGGTVGGFRRSILERFGGWDETILAEDTDLTFRVYLEGYRVSYVNDAECYEEAVEDWQKYRRQRYRWARGHMQCAFKHSLKVLKSKNLRLVEKIDGLLLLNVYFMPVLALLSWIICIPLFFYRPFQLFETFWSLAPISLYSFVGNFAPFFEVGIGAYLDGRTRAHWLISFLIFTFLYNIPICTKAFADLLFSKITGKNDARWQKTTHSGNGNSYIMN